MICSIRDRIRVIQELGLDQLYLVARKISRGFKPWMWNNIIEGSQSPYKIVNLKTLNPS